jgi:hypothetical protein
MRVLQLVGFLFGLGMFVYAVSSYSSISDAMRPGSRFNDPPPKPLAEAAPEVATLRADFRRLAMDALAQVPLCVERDPLAEPARPRGRVLIWDVEEHDVSLAHGCLPPELRLQSVDEPCTVYLITERQRSHTLDYQHDIWGGGGNAGVKGFRIDLVVCAVDLPSGQPRGRYQIDGHGPPSMAPSQPGVKEIDENWAANLKRWIDVCVQGGESRQIGEREVELYRKADAARQVIADCERIGSLPTLGKFPREVVLYDLQTDSQHPAASFVVGLASPEADSLLMVLPLEDKLVIDRRAKRGRLDSRVALVAFPGAEPLGVYQVQGETWPLPEGTIESWSNPRDSRDPHPQIARWVHDLIRLQRGLPAGTIRVVPDDSHLAGTSWLQGPGWREPSTK